MQIKLTEKFLRDFQDLSSSLANKCRVLIKELQHIEPSELRNKVLPGWRLHNLSESNLVSLSIDMNFRVLGELDRGGIIFHRVVKHDSADRVNVNRNDRAKAIAQMTINELPPAAVYTALRSFGVTDEAERFLGCSSEEDLLSAAADVSDATANLALTLYETSSLVIRQARFRVLQKDQDFQQILEGGGGDWEIYLHPSQEFIVELPASFRAAVAGSAGTGKTICAWHRIKYLIDYRVSVGFVCPNESVLNISKNHLLGMVGPGTEGSFFFVPKQPDELIQLAEVVDHIIIDEAQEIPITWLLKLSEKMSSKTGVTLFYDINQLGGHIENGDVARYKRRISDWKIMLVQFNQMQKFSLCINYRNSREIAEHYLTMLSKVLPAKPLADVPVFEAGEVVQRRTKREDLNNVLTSIIRHLIDCHAPREIGVVIFDQGPESVRRALAERKLPVTDDPANNGIVVTKASRIRGHERQAIIVITKNAYALRRNFGLAIDAYIAMSRAVKRLLIIEVTA